MTSPKLPGSSGVTPLDLDATIDAETSSPNEEDDPLETSPLLQRVTTSDTVKVVELRAPKLLTRRSVWAICLGIIALIILHLFFLQRTSVMRDFRRWHHLHLTYTDVKRNYLQLLGIANETETATQAGLLGSCLDQFHELNLQNPVNLVLLDNHIADYVIDKFDEYGLDVEVVKHDSDGPQYPVDLSLALLRQNLVIYAPLLHESVDDPTPAYYGFGANGSVLGEYVWVNYGSEDDYQWLEDAQVPVAKKIAIVRIHPHNRIRDVVARAQEQGILAVVAYIDPGTKADPENYLLMSRAVQRDTLTSIFGWKPKIVAVPVAYDVIKPVLDTLLTKNAIDWPINPTPRVSELTLRVVANFSSSKPRVLETVIGTIPGIIRDVEVILGAPRDSFAQEDMLSNHAIMLEIARHFRQLVKLGWKPMRTIRFVLWDGLNNGLLSSQQVAFDPARANKVVGYINLDSQCVSGSRFQVASSPLLRHFVEKTTGVIPYAGGTLADLWANQTGMHSNDIIGSLDSDALMVFAGTECPVIDVKYVADPRDLSVFVPNSNTYGYEWANQTNVDHGNRLHLLLVRLAGLLMISMSEREMVDYLVEDYMKRIGNYTHEWVNQADPDILAAPVARLVVSGWQIDQGVANLTVAGLVDQLLLLVPNAISTGQEIDVVNAQALQGVRTDFAWYFYHRKLLQYAKFKRGNYRLLRVEQGFQLSDSDLKFLAIDKTETHGFTHVIYGVGTNGLTGLWQAGDAELVARWLVVIYEKLYRYNEYRVLN